MLLQVDKIVDFILLFVKYDDVILLENDQEKADTKVLPWSQHATTSHWTGSVCIKTVDSEIAIYVLYFQYQLDADFFVKIVHSKRQLQKNKCQKNRKWAWNRLLLCFTSTACSFPVMITQVRFIALGKQKHWKYWWHLKKFWRYLKHEIRFCLMQAILK